MQTVIGFVVLFAIGYAFYKFRVVAGQGIHRALRPGAYKKGKNLVDQTLEFTAPVPAAEFVARVLYTLDPQPEAGLRMNLFVQEHSVYEDGDHLVVLTQGTKLGINFQVMLVVVPEEDRTHCGGIVSVSHYHETEGVVDYVDVIERVFNHVQEATSHFGGSIL